MRYQMRESRAWETTDKAHNKEYLRFYSIPEREIALENELAKYISAGELKWILATKSRTTQLLALQSKTVRELFAKQEIVVLQFVDMQKSIKELLVQQGRAERIKEFPYPRQFAIISTLFVRLFCLLLPFGLLGEFDDLDGKIEGTIWLVVPFSVLISWMYTSLDRVGESTENPFEGSANDIPISQMCRAVEIDLREMLGEDDLPPLLQPRNSIVL
jgi:putative membrane protein